MKHLYFIFMAIIALVFMPLWAQADISEKSLDKGGKEIVFGGSTSANNLIFALHKDIFSEKDTPYSVVTSSSGRGVLALLNSTIDVAMISSDLGVIVKKLQNQGHDIDIDDYNVHPLETSRVLFVTHPQNAIDTLTKRQIIDILDGDVQSWDQINQQQKDGFANDINGAVQLVTEHETGGMYNMLQHHFLDGRSFKNDKIVMQNAPQVTIVVSQLKEAIGFVSDSTPIEQMYSIKVVHTPEVELVQDIAFVTKKDDRREIIHDLIKAVKIVLEKDY